MRHVGSCDKFAVDFNANCSLSNHEGVLPWLENRGIALSHFLYLTSQYAIIIRLHRFLSGKSAFPRKYFSVT